MFIFINVCNVPLICKICVSAGAYFVTVYIRGIKFSERKTSCVYALFVWCVILKIPFDFFG